jgi:asparagine synthase (glutamine-hydrolysing)
MCGIAGLLQTNGAAADAAVLEAMGDLMDHRGPDGRGQITAGPLGLAHRRLSILDVREIANQPMHGGDGRYTLIFNGEVYNFVELREKLEKGHGVRFETTGDSEVVLQALIHWGAEAFSRFDGMFAIAFLDRKHRTLLLGRDRYGIKPLYIYRGQNVWSFASEMKCFRALPGAHFPVDEDGLNEYLTFMNFMGERTLFKTVTLFPAGSHQTIALDDQATLSQRPVQFWDFRFTGNNPDYNEAEWVERIHESFTAAVRRQMVSDVGVSSFLSGGVDSGSITAVASREVARDDARIKTFTACFNFEGVTGAETLFDEREAAKLMSKRFGTHHHEVMIGPKNFRDVYRPLIDMLDEPRVGQSYPNLIVSGLVRQSGEKVVLSGCGGDELFAGYPWRYRRGMPADNFGDYLDGYYAYWRRLGRNDAELAAMRVRQGGANPRDAFDAVFPTEARDARTPADFINWALYFEAKTFMQGLLLVEDKVSMSHGLETRVPFLDNDFVDLAQQAPIQSKLHGFDLVGGYTLPQATSDGRSSDGKIILRKMMERLVPKEISERKKQGFSAPDSTWWAGTLHDLVRDELTGRDRGLHEHISRDFLTELLDGHREGSRDDGRHKIWAMLSLAGTLDAFDAA